MILRYPVPNWPADPNYQEMNIQVTMNVAKCHLHLMLSVCEFNCVHSLGTIQMTILDGALQKAFNFKEVYHTHLRGNHGANFGKDHMTSEGKKDVVAECCEPHHPFKISHILKVRKKVTMNN